MENSKEGGISLPRPRPVPPVQQSDNTASSSRQPETHDRHPRYPINVSLVKLVDEDEPVRAMATDMDGLLYVGSDDSIIWVRKSTTGPIENLIVTTGHVCAIVVDMKGHVFSLHKDGHIRMWEVDTIDPSRYNLSKILTLPMDERQRLHSRINLNQETSFCNKKISCLSLSDDMKYMYAGTWDNSIMVYRVNDSRLVDVMSDHKNRVNTVAVGYPSLVFSGSDDCYVHVYKREIKDDVVKHTALGTLVCERKPISALIFDSGTIGKRGLYVGLAAQADNLMFWPESEKWYMPHVFMKCHRAPVSCLAECGQNLFSGSLDGVICIWRWNQETNSHVLAKTLMAHAGAVSCIAAHHDWATGRWFFVSAGEDRLRKSWEIVDTPPLDDAPHQENQEP